MKPGALLAPLRNSSAWRRPSVIALLAANFIPLVCVIAFEWDVFPLMLLFWTENLIIGGFNILKMLACQTGGTSAALSKLFLVPFFTVHYGMFTLVHGVFVVTLFGGGTNHSGLGPDMIFAALREQQLVVPVLALAVSHGVSFATNYLRRGEYRTVTLPQLMFQPYGRIVILHVTILGGGFLMLALKSPTLGLAFLVVVKCVVDLVSHLREREKSAARAETAADT
jgi:hypothetical protein